MEKLLSSSWPAKWEEVNRFAKDGMATVSLAHINPDTENNPGITVLKTGCGIATGIMSVKPEKCDFIGHLSIVGYSDKQTAKQFFESYQNIPTPGASAPTPGASADIPLGDLIKAFVPEETAKELESALKEVKHRMEQSGAAIERKKYLGEEALFVVGKNGKKIAQAVLIDNFVITGLLLATDSLENGNKKIHALKCGKQKPPPKSHPPCSTLKAEGYLHKEEVEQINRDIFSGIKGLNGRMMESETLNEYLIFDGKKLSHYRNDKEVASWAAISGPYGRGKLPAGRYRVTNLKMRPEQGMTDPAGLGWSLELDALFESGREFLRIHPDGGIYGTRGCIGIKGDTKDAYAFFKKYFQNKKEIFLRADYK